MTRPPPYCGGKRPDGARLEARKLLQPACRGQWKVLAAGLAVFLAACLAGPAQAAEQTLPAVPAPVPAGQPIPEVEPVQSCPPEHDLCVESQEQGDYDARAGVAELHGDVRGYMRSRDLRFNSQRLRALRVSADGQRRVELYGAVRLAEPGWRIAADSAVLENEVATLSGNVRMEEREHWAEGESAAADRGARQAGVRERRGRPAAKQAAPSAGLGDGTQAWAQRAVMERDTRQLNLTGAVHVNVPVKQISLDAESVTLQFSRQGTVTGFSARGNVQIVQPGRRLNADSARSQYRMQTILLLGKARVQQEGQFDLTSDRMEVFVDARRGAVHSEDRQKPMNFSLDVDALRGWKLDASRLDKLREQGVPDALLKKLAPMEERTFKSQALFEQAVAERLTPEESDRYLSTISKQAHP